MCRCVLVGEGEKLLKEYPENIEEAALQVLPIMYQGPNQKLSLENVQRMYRLLEIGACVSGHRHGRRVKKSRAL